MELMSEENILLTSENKEATLTTHRFRFQTKNGGKSYVASIMLEELCSCELTHKSSPLLLVLSLIFLIAGMVIGSTTEESAVTYIGIILAVIFLIAFFFSRRGVISLASASKTINLKTSGMSLEKMTHFIDEVESAKNQRYLRRQ